MQIYRASGPHIQRQVWITLALIGLLAVKLFAADDHTQQGLSSYLTAENIVAVGMTVFAAGTLREQFAEVRKRLETTEARHVRFVEETAPETYARRDVVDQQIQALRAELNHPQQSRTL